MTTFELSVVEHLAARLEPVCAELEQRDRSLLHAIFAWAGEAVMEEAEVSGFTNDLLGLSGLSLTKSFIGNQAQINIESFSFGSTSPRSGSSSQPSGKNPHQPFQIT